MNYGSVGFIGILCSFTSLSPCSQFPPLEYISIEIRILKIKSARIEKLRSFISMNQPFIPAQRCSQTPRSTVFERAHAHHLRHLQTQSVGYPQVMERTGADLTRRCPRPWFGSFRTEPARSVRRVRNPGRQGADADSSDTARFFRPTHDPGGPHVTGIFFS